VADVTQGKYEYQYRADETQQSTGTSTYQDSRSSGTPRYTPTPDRTYGESSQTVYSTSPVTPEYTTSTFEEATAAFENLTLEKGKDRETGNFMLYIRIFNTSQLTIERICGPDGVIFILSPVFNSAGCTYCIARDG
jgi:hypothetical protein